MSDIQKQKRWFKELETELNKYFEASETQEIMNYYEEMMNDKLDDGEDIDNILNEYKPKQIAKSMIPRVVSNRKINDHKFSSSLWLILLILFSTPVLIPLGVVYIVFMVVAASLIFSGIAMIVGGFIGTLVNIIELLGQGLVGGDLLIATGAQLLVLGILIAIGYLLAKVSWKVLQYLAMWFGKLIDRKREKNEIN